ncbi:MAG: DegQ family serine endoprotease [Gammaproteobacteria bacterium]|nr:DegQ family serine endoprotease [Gammaproteobacteria bacterium]MCY4281773.1 DegQ family serine endoprotease [Gammaproteobacteria bacterium]
MDNLNFVRYFAPHRGSGRRSVLIAILLFSISTQAALPRAAGSQQLPSLAPMLEQVTPAVVNIATEGRVQVRQNPLFSDPFFRRFFNVPDQPMERKTQSLGSGVIVDAERGLVLTNNHVIANAVQITVTLRDGRHLEAEIVGSDPATDVAVIKVPADNLIDIGVADSDVLRVGDFVVAIGNPFGLGQTVTSGIVSALSRSGLGIEGYEDFIQTDASINPGNSGGALVNLHGELVGINTAIFSRGGGNIGIGFAIPINLALQIMEQLLDKGEVERGFIGVQVQNLNTDLAEAFGIKNQKGAVVNSVMPDSPAEEAGLQPGDIIVSINSKPVKAAADVRNHIGLLPVGERVTFDILRAGERMSLHAKVVAATDLKLTRRAARNPRLNGVILGEISEEHPFYGRVKGVIITEVKRGSRGWSSGLRQGDIITSVNRQSVADLDAFLQRVDKLEGSLLLRVIRGDAAAFLVIK